MQVIFCDSNRNAARKKSDKPKTKKAKSKVPKQALAESQVPEVEIEVIEPEIEILPAELADQDLDVIDEVLEEVEPKASTKEVVPYSALQAYLNEISKFKPLSREEEHEIAVTYYKNKERDAAYKLISSNLWLVVKIAREYEKAARSLLDLVQEGNIGLMEAVGNFDPYRGVRFPSYAVWWIKAYIIRYVMANWRMVKIGTTQAQRKLFFNLKKEKEKLEREGFYPAPKLLAEKLNVKEHEVVEMEQRLGSSDMSMDAPVNDEGDNTLLSMLPAKQPNPEDLISAQQMQNVLKSALDKFKISLNDKEKLIFESRLLSEEKATLQEIADKLSLSKERVRQLEERIKTRLKQYLSGVLGESVDSSEFSGS